MLFIRNYIKYKGYFNFNNHLKNEKYQNRKGKNLTLQLISSSSSSCSNFNFNCYYSNYYYTTSSIYSQSLFNSYQIFHYSNSSSHNSSPLISNLNNKESNDNNNNDNNNNNNNNNDNDKKKKINKDFNILFEEIKKKICNDNNNINDIILYTSKLTFLKTYHYNLIINYYIQCNLIKQSEKFFRSSYNNKIKLFQPNVITYTSLINGYSKLSDCKSCMRLLNEMKKNHIQPNIMTYSSVMKSYSNLLLPNITKKILFQMIQDNIEPSIISFNIVINSYIKKSLPLEAFSIYKFMLKKYPKIFPDHATYTILLTGLSNNHPKQLEIVLANMRTHSLRQQKDQFIECQEEEEREEVNKNKKNKNKNNKINTTITTSTTKYSKNLIIPIPTWSEYRYVVDGFSKQQQPFLARYTMKKIIKDYHIIPSASSYTILIQSFINIESYHMAEVVLKEMDSNNISPTQVTYEAIIKAFCDKLNFNDAKKFLWKMLENEFIPSENCYGFVLECFANSKEPVLAEQFLNEIIDSKYSNILKQPETLYAKLTTIYGNDDKPIEAERIYRFMISKGMRINKYVPISLVTSFVKSGYVKEGEKLFRDILHEKRNEKNIKLNNNNNNNNINNNNFNKSGNKSDNDDDYYKIAFTTIYNSLLNGYAKEYSVSNVLRIFEEMKSFQTPLNKNKSNNNNNNNNNEEEENEEDKEEQNSLKKLLKLNSSDGLPDALTYNILIKLYIELLEPNIAEEYLRELIRLFPNCQLDENVYIKIVHAYHATNQQSEGVRIYNEMKSKKSLSKNE